jgi:putative phosphoesterase
VILAVVSDTHLPRGVRRLPHACVERMRSADAILHAGDLFELSTLRLLEGLGPPVHAVAGNMDSPELKLRLPRICTVGRIAMIHDAGPAPGRLIRMRRTFPNVDAVVFGHSHMPLHEERDGFQIFNPGSPTERRRAPKHTMGMVSDETGRLEFELIELD